MANTANLYAFSKRTNVPDLAELHNHKDYEQCMI